MTISSFGIRYQLPRIAMHATKRSKWVLSASFDREDSGSGAGMNRSYREGASC